MTGIGHQSTSSAYCTTLFPFGVSGLQVRRDASKVLSEFKRTHEEDALEQLRQQLGEEQWEAVSQVTSSASYFV